MNQGIFDDSNMSINLIDLPNTCQKRATTAVSQELLSKIKLLMYINYNSEWMSPYIETALKKHKWIILFIQKQTKQNGVNKKPVHANLSFLYIFKTKERKTCGKSGRSTNNRKNFSKDNNFKSGHKPDVPRLSVEEISMNDNATYNISPFNPR